MAAKVKIPLKMVDGSTVRTLEDLIEHFDLISVLGHYDSGRLYSWLTDYYFNEEAEKINALDSSADDFKKSLCDILGVPYVEDDSVSVDLSDISERNKRLAKLRTFTADDTILAAVDKVVFTQEELDSLFDKDIDVIYLCGEQFNISADKRGIRYIGVNTPKVSIPDNIGEININLHSVKFDLDGILTQAKAASDQVKTVELWRMAAEQGHAEAQYRLGKCYSDGLGVDYNEEEAVKWYLKAAEQGYVEAQYRLGECYDIGDGVEENKKEAAKWYLKAMEQGYDEAIDSLFYMDFDCEVVESMCKVAEKGNVNLQCELGYRYRCGWDALDLNVNEEESVKWYRKAAEQGHDKAIDELFSMSYDCDEALEALCKVAE